MSWIGNDRASIARRASAAFVAYAFSKVSILLAPLLISAILPLPQYGVVEYSLSVGQLASVALALGIPSAVPYFLLKRGRPLYRPVFTLHMMVVVAVSLATAAFAETAGYAVLGLASLISGISVTQSVTSAKFRSAGSPVGSALAEGTLYILLLIFGVALYAEVVPRSLLPLRVMLGSYLLAVLAYCVVTFPWKTRRLRLKRLYRNSVGYGFRVVPASFANVGLVSSGRFLIGMLGSFEQVAIFSVAYRMSAPIVAIHQFIANLVFRDLYKTTVTEFQQYFVRLSLLLIAAGVALAIVGPSLTSALLGDKARLIAGRPDLFVLMPIVMILWSQLSLMELFMERENRSYRQLPGFIAGLAVAWLPVLIPGSLKIERIDGVLLFQGLGLTAAVLWQFYQSGAGWRHWRAARGVVAVQVAVLLSLCIIMRFRV